MKRRLIKINSLTQARLIAAMLDGDKDCRELSELTGLHYVTVLRYCRELRLAGAAHINAWHLDVRGRSTVKVFKIGRGRDKPRPPAKTNNEKAALYRERKRAKRLQLVVAGAARLEKAANGRVRFAMNERKDAA